MTIPTNRPRPIKAAANAVTKTLGMISSLVTAAAGYGIVTAVQDDAVQGLLGAIPGVITLVGNLLIAFNIVARSEPKVTPMSDPRDNSGNQLASVSSSGGLMGHSSM